MNFNRSVRHRERERERNRGREGVRKKESGDKIKKIKLLSKFSTEFQVHRCLGCLENFQLCSKRERARRKN